MINSERSALEARNGLTNGPRLSLIEVFACYLDIDAFMLLLDIHKKQLQTKRLFAEKLAEKKKVTEEPFSFTHLFSFRRIMTKLLFVFSVATIAQPTDSLLLPLPVFALVFATEQPNPPLACNYCPLRDLDLFL